MCELYSKKNEGKRPNKAVQSRTDLSKHLVMLLQHVTGSSHLRVQECKHPWHFSHTGCFKKLFYILKLFLLEYHLIWWQIRSTSDTFTIKLFSRWRCVDKRKCWGDWLGHLLWATIGQAHDDFLLTIPANRERHAAFRNLPFLSYQTTELNRREHVLEKHKRALGSSPFLYRAWLAVLWADGKCQAPLEPKQHDVLGHMW